MDRERGLRRRPARGSLLVAAIGLLLLLMVVAVLGCTSTGTTATGNTGSTTAATQVTGTTVTQPGDIGVSPAQAVAKGVSPSVVNVRASGAVSSPYFGGQQQYQGVGSGIIYNSEGMIVTNNHVVTVSGSSGQETPAQSLVVTLKTGEQLKATIVGRDPYTDIAVIKVDKTGLPPASFQTNRAKVQVGEYAIAIGSPLDYANSVSLGIVSGLQRNIQGAGSGAEAQALIDLLQTDAPISPGNSGGALVDASGQVIVVNVAYIPPQQTGAQNIGFAIPADTVVSVADQIIKSGRVSHVYLGINYQPVTSDLQQQFNLPVSTGVIVTQIAPNTPASKAGLQQSDIIVAIDGKPVTGEGDLFLDLRQKKAGDSLKVTVNRNGKTQDITVVLAERPTG